MPQPAGIRDVARRAGVSVATVSNVFNRPEIVAAPTRARVEAAVRELGYVRNESARQLRMGQSRTIGLIVPDIANPFFTDVARGVEDVTSAAGALVIVCNSDDDVVKEERYLTLLAEQQVQGALVVPVGTSQAVSRLVDRGIPVVLLDSTALTEDQCSVSVDDVTGGQLAAAHLLARGHTRIAFVGAGSEAPQVIDRTAGATQAVLDAGGSPADLLLVPVVALNVAGGTAAAQQLVALPARRRPTAIVCVNDLLALGVLYELLRQGVRVPDDMAIVGYDDITFAESAAVPLTSVRQPRQQLGRRAAELLLEESGSGRQEGHEHTHLVFEPELIERQSSDITRPVRRSAGRRG